MKAVFLTLFIGIFIYIISLSIIDMYQREIIDEFNLLYLSIGLFGIVIILLIFIIYKFTTK